MKKKNGSLGIAVVKGIRGGILRVKHAEYPPILRLSRRFSKSQKNQVIWLIAILVFIGTAALVQGALSDTIYLPVIIVEPTWTPSLTPSKSSTPTPTPTITPTPTKTPIYYVSILEIVNSDTMDPLNEYVSIFNKGSKVANLTDWYIRDDGPNRYDFPTNFYIASKQTIRLWTKEGENTTTDLYWGSKVEVWNNARDCAYLRDNSEGKKILVHKFCYPEADDDSNQALWINP